MNLTLQACRKMGMKAKIRENGDLWFGFGGLKEPLDDSRIEGLQDAIEKFHGHRPSSDELVNAVDQIAKRDEVSQ